MVPTTKLNKLCARCKIFPVERKGNIVSFHCRACDETLASQYWRQQVDNWLEQQRVNANARLRPG